MHDAVLEYGRTALRDEELGAESVATYDGWLQLVRDGVRAAVDAGLIREPDDIDGERVGATKPTWPLPLSTARRSPDDRHTDAQPPRYRRRTGHEPKAASDRWRSASTAR
ncbi:hypothetical protein [Streptomyces europaeiscabiei]|uniref:hypothetical protein n=1 Tax=Streptomyces europaeiscabiei TaxID=146819 RepID=UPI002E18DDA6